MSTLQSTRRNGRGVLLLGLCLATSALAGNALPSITVQAVPSKTVVAMSTTGIPIEVVTLAARVSYADLDLTTREGAQTLKRRVIEAARATCRKLDDLYPLEEPLVPICIGRAVGDATSEIERAIARAREAAKAR